MAQCWLFWVPSREGCAGRQPLFREQRLCGRLPRNWAVIRLEGQADTLTFMQTKTIYIPMLDEGTAVWTPVIAQPISSATYRIGSEPLYPDDENWAFRSGQEVTVEEHTFQDGNCGLVAVGPAAHARWDLTRAETDIVQNALNEICNGISLGDEFETRIGATVGEARALLERVSGLRRQ
ncbi:hypothetical protein D1Y84_14750 [Acidipila sp. EB88]|nr:hypothetical protein D1Y84_14750 [Acidipila sp. EB88]